jgi:SOS regulatory protein LexA
MAIRTAFIGRNPGNTRRVQKRGIGRCEFLSNENAAFGQILQAAKGCGGQVARDAPRNIAHFRGPAREARAVIIPSDLDRPEIIDIPIYGRIAAGYGDSTQPEPEGCLSIDITSLGCRGKNETFALRVRGESMIDAHICDGDTVILEKREARNGDVVAALIDGETTLKRFISQKGKTYLQAENPKFPDLIPTDELIIQGVMIALLRKAA